MLTWWLGVCQGSGWQGGLWAMGELMIGWAGVAKMRQEEKKVIILEWPKNGRKEVVTVGVILPKKAGTVFI